MSRWQWIGGLICIVILVGVWLTEVIRERRKRQSFVLTVSQESESGEEDLDAIDAGHSEAGVGRTG